MLWPKWEKLPPEMQVSQVRPYYDALQKKKAALTVKRAFDALAAFVLLLLLLPLELAIAAAIRLDSPGPVFFRQTRVTAYGRAFRIWKFRTMVDGADKGSGQLTVSADSRVTRVGKRLRGCRLDELPQLINILTGEMSFVGTRPEVPRYVAAYTPEMRATLLLPAGVTSEASILYKDENELLENAEDAARVYVEQVLPGKMRYNLDSLRHFSCLNDLKTMVRTVLAVCGVTVKEGQTEGEGKAV